MATYNIPLTTIDEAEVVRYAGSTKLAPAATALAAACRDTLLLARARASWQLYSYDQQRINELTLCGQSITAHLADCTEVAVLAVTIGPALEAAVSKAFAAGEYSAGLLLDAAGTTAVEAAADAANAYIAAEASRRGLEAVNRFSPGYGDWPLAQQPAVLKLADGEAVGIEVTESCMLLPRKSVTAVIGLRSPADGSPPVICQSSCSNCAKINCLARKE